MTSTKTKSALILSVVLIVGMVLGFFLNTIFMKNKFERFKRMRKPEGMKEMIFEHLNPTEQQKNQLEEILDRFEERMEVLRQESFSNLNKMKDSLDLELKPILTEEQFEKLNNGLFRKPMRQPHRGEPRYWNDRDKKKSADSLRGKEK